MKEKFSSYMNRWLYSDSGYYSKYKRIGKEGDFYTAVSSSRFFGGAIAKRFLTILNDEKFLKKDTTIVEIGAHHGYLLADIIQFIYTLEPKLIDTLSFAIVERYEHLREAQLDYFEKSFGDRIKLKHFNDISEIKLDSAFIVANEIFDAFGCELIKDNQMAYIDENHEVEFGDLDSITKDKIDRFNLNKGEVPVGYEEFANSLKSGIKKFSFVTFDYGDLEARRDFSIRIYDKHKVHPFFEDNLDLDRLFSNSDITYDVNFEILKRVFEDIGIETLSYKTQLKALVDFGLMDLLQILQDNVSDEVYLREVGKVKTLIDPTIMGERFKMIEFRGNF